jgi:hypothetical protein
MHHFCAPSGRARPAMFSTTVLFAGVLLLAGCSAERAVSVGDDAAVAILADVTRNLASGSTVTLVIGDSAALTATTTTRRGRVVRWSSSNEAVMRVSSTGIAVAMGTGSATVTAAGVSSAERWGFHVAKGTGVPTPPVVPPTVPPTAPPPTAPLGLNAALGRVAPFPSDKAWNQPVDTAQVDPNSATIIANIGTTKSFHPTSVRTTTAARSAFRTTSSRARRPVSAARSLTTRKAIMRPIRFRRMRPSRGAPLPPATVTCSSSIVITQSCTNCMRPTRRRTGAGARVRAPFSIWRRMHYDQRAGRRPTPRDCRFFQDWFAGTR